MKRKGLTIGLLLIVASIWGAVLTKVWNPKDDIQEEVTSISLDAQRIQVLVDTLPPTSSLGNYRDPFLETLPVRHVTPVDASTRTNAAPRQARKANPAVAKAWPKILYNGLIRNAAHNRTVALLNINGHDAMLIQGVEDPSGLKVVRVFADSVSLALNDEVRSFRR